jgi:ABC-type amino acid transport substrate-binding protein
MGMARSSSFLRKIFGGRSSSPAEGERPLRGPPGNAAGEIRFILGSQQPPNLFRGPKGEPSGLHVDVAELLAAELGARCRLVFRSHAQVIETLLARGGDAIVGMSPSEERRKLVSFTSPFGQDYLRLVARKDFERPPTPEGAKGLKIGVWAGGYGEIRAREIFGSAAEIVPLSGEGDVLAHAMVEGKVDLGFTFFLALYGFVASPLGRNFKILDGPYIPPIPICIALRKDDDALLAKLNAALARIRSDGRLDAIRAKWTPFTI